MDNFEPVYNSKKRPSPTTQTRKLSKKYHEKEEYNEIDEMRNHVFFQVAKPNFKQPQHTKNLWKSAYSQPITDDVGRRHSSFSSDLLTPFYNQYKMKRIGETNREVKPAAMKKMVFEKNNGYKTLDNNALYKH
jgi:hypothetical protein